MSSSSDTNNESYVPIPNAPNPTEPPSEPSRPEHHHHKPEQKVVLLIFCGFLLLASLVAFNGYEKEHNDGSPTLVCEDLTPNLVPKLAWKPVSRGVSSGVSEKSSNKLFIGNNWEYPWTHEMLSWQRTSYHFQPEKNWMNDPNGPLFYKGWYHIFYQYNPRSPVWGPGEIVWGHAVSRELIHWLHLPLALVSDKWYDENGVWTGSATILPNGKVIMLYTGSTNEKVQVQNLAYPANPSDPLLIDWVKYSGNPVLLPPPGIDSLDFRDPTTAWLTSEGKWRLTIGSKINDTGIALVYDTKDFKRFVLKRQILRAVPGTGMWECVDFFPVSANDADNYGLDTSVIGDDVRHVMKVSLDEERHDYYAIGTYDENNVTFIPDDTQNDLGTGLRLDYGIFYASKTFYDHKKNRRVLWSWIGESDDEYVDVAKGWASLIGIPRTVRLDTKTGTNLLQWPVEEVEELRLKSKEFKNLKAMPGSMVPLDINGIATQVDIVAEFDIDKEAVEKTKESDLEYKCETSGGAADRGALGPFGILVLADECHFEYTPIYFYIVKGIDGNLKTSFCSDQSRSSLAYNVDKSIYGSSVPVLKDEKLSIRILVDHSIVESFAQGGRTCVTSRVYPTRAVHGATQLYLFNNATEAAVNASVKVWQMDSASISPFHVD